MTAGFQLFNDDGTTTIDDRSRNMSLRYRRSYPPSAWDSRPNLVYRTIQIQVPASGFNAPVFAMKAQAGDSVVLVYQYEYNGLHYLVLARWGNTTVSGNVEVLVFDDYEPNRPNFGLEVFNDAGQVMYNSDWPVMKVHRLIVIPPSVPLFMSNTTYTVSDFENTADIALAITHNRDYYHGSSDGYSMTVGGRKTANGFVFSLICYASESDSFPGGGAVRFTGYLVNEPLTVLAIDTRNLPPAPFG